MCLVLLRMSEDAGVRLKLNKKLKISIGKSKNHRKGNENSVEKGGAFGRKRNSTVVSKSRKRNSNRYGVTEGSNDREVHFEEEETHSKPVMLNYDRRRKRVDSDNLISYKNNNLEGTDRHRKAASSSSSSEKHRKMVKHDLSKGRKGNDKSIRSIWVSPDVTSTTKAIPRNPKTAARSAKEEDEMDTALNDSSKKHTKVKAKAKANLDQNANASPLISVKKKVRDKKSLKNDSEVLDDKPKKKKRVIRLDPYDISNKRLDDGTAINGQYSLTFSSECLQFLYLQCLPSSSCTCLKWISFDVHIAVS